MRPARGPGGDPLEGLRRERMMGLATNQRQTKAVAECGAPRPESGAPELGALGASVGRNLDGRLGAAPVAGLPRVHLRLRRAAEARQPRILRRLEPDVDSVPVGLRGT